jgi:hypothetical protein
MRAQVTVVTLAVIVAAGGCKQSGSNTATAQAPQSAAAPVTGANGVRTNSSAPAARHAFTGSVVEMMSSGGYTYARLQSAGHDDVWIAAPQFDARVGEQISASLDMPMQNFESRTLKRTFPLVYFVTDVSRAGSLVATQQGAPPALMTSHGAAASLPAAPAVARVDPPAGGLSIADVFAKRAGLSGRQVTVRGTVVKFNGGIMDRNWVHIQDGSGSASSSDNDLTITTDAQVAVGDVITASGVLGISRDFGAGYAYDAILEKATITK